MLKRLIPFFSLIVVGNFVLKAQLAIIPYPNQLELKTGSIYLANKTTVYISNAELGPQLNYLSKKLEAYDIKFIKAKKNKATLVFQIDPQFKEKNQEEGYQLQIDRRKVLIKAATAHGIFNGIQSLLQLVQANKKLPALIINDSPQYGWRGLMLDESRHFFGVEKVKSLLDWMAFYKLNTFHWHLTDEPAWRLTIDQYPLLTTVGGMGSYTNPKDPAKFYTKKDVEAIVNYAKERFINVIPEVDMPGHATAANKAYPMYSGGGSAAHPEFTFNPGKEEVYTYLSEILKETKQQFPSNMLHLGGDEVSFGTDKWDADSLIKNLKKKANLKNNLEVEQYFMKRMADSVFAMQSKILVWDEMVNAGLPVDSTIIFWWRHDKPSQLLQSLNKGYPTVICPRLPLYFDFVQEQSHQHGRKWDGKFNDLLSIYHFDIGQIVKDQNQKKLILGIQANLWTETVQNEQRLDYLLFPRMAALAEAAWTLPINRNDQRFEAQVKTHLKWYAMAGLNYFNPFQPQLTPEPASKRRLPLNYKDND